MALETPLDLSVLKQLYDDLGQEHFATIVEGFLGDIESRLPELKQSLEAGDVPTATRQAHSIKSNLNACGAIDAGLVAYSIERTSADLIANGWQDQFAALEDVVSNAKIMVRQVLTSPRF